MPAFDTLPIDPDRATLVRALTEIARRANEGFPAGQVPGSPGAYRSLASGRYARQPEGVRLWASGRRNPATFDLGTDATLLGVAWWTDPAGRRHVRVAGRRLRRLSEHQSARFGPLGEFRPPLCYIAPEGVVLRTLPGGTPELLAVCACGAVGTPEALGWMGDCCGPCHDHREERGERLPSAGARTLFADGLVMALSWSASGATLAGCVRPSTGDSETGSVVFWDPATGAVRHSYPHPWYLSASLPPFAGDGRVVAADGEGVFRVWDAETGEQRFEEEGEVGNPRTYRLALPPDGRTVVASGDRWLLTRRLKAGSRWRRPPGGPSAGHELCGALAFSPDGKALARGLDHRRVTLLDWPGARERILSTAPEDPSLDSSTLVRSLAFSPDGNTLAAAQGTYLQEFNGIQDPTPGQVELYDVRARRLRLRLPAQDGSLYAVAFTPDGRGVLGAGVDRVVRFWDVATGAEVAALEAHVGTVRALCFSPDGNTLAAGSADGTIRLWPWRQLLPDR
jgi:hypothetical protein